MKIELKCKNCNNTFTVPHWSEHTSLHNKIRKQERNSKGKFKKNEKL